MPTSPPKVPYKRNQITFTKDYHTIKEMGDSNSILKTLYQAVKAVPITGAPITDALLLYATGMRESRFKSPTIKNPTSTALGYFQIIEKTRNDLAKKYGLKWDNTLLGQAKFAAAGYNDVYRTLQRNPKYMRAIVDGYPGLNTISNLTYRYAGGFGKYSDHPHALTAAGLIKDYFGWLDAGMYMDAAQAGKLRGDFIPEEGIIPELLFGDCVPCLFKPTSPVDPIGDPSSSPLADLIFMAPHLEPEYEGLPEDVRLAVDRLRALIDDSELHVSSILSSFTGPPRTRENGPNHIQHRAIDIVPAPIGQGPFYKDGTGKLRSPHFNWNKFLIATLKAEHKRNPFPAAVVLETDHIHVDDTHPAGVYVLESHRSSFDNDNTALCPDFKGSFQLTKLA